MIRNWGPYTLGALRRGTGCTPLEPALILQGRNVSEAGSVRTIRYSVAF
jgi:hypothetical protein